MSNTIIFGDSNIHFLSFVEKAMESTDVNHSTVEGCKKSIVDNENIYFMWKYRASASKFNKEYILEKIYDYKINISNINNIVFHFGYNDLCNIKDPEDIKEIFENYIYNGYYFAKENEINVYFTTPVSPLKHIKKENIDLCIEIMYKICNDLDIKLINIYDVIPLKYSSEDWDEYLHLDRKYSKILLKYILENIKEK